MAFDREHRWPGFAPYPLTSSSDVWEAVVDSTFWQTYVAPGTPPVVAASLPAQGSTGALTPTLATHAAGNLLLLVAFNCNQPTLLTTANGWTQYTSASNGAGVSGGTGAALCDLYYKVAASASETAPTFDGYANHIGVISLTVTGADNVPANWVAATSPTGSSTTAVTMPDVTTASADSLVLLICNTSQDQTGGTLATLTNATISPVLVEASGVTDGNGSVGNIFAGTMATAGATGTSSGTLATTSNQARAVIAFPPAPVGGTFQPAWAAHANQRAR